MNQTMYVRYLSWDELKEDVPQMTEWYKLTRDIAISFLQSDFWQAIDFRYPDFAEGSVIRCTRSSKKGKKNWFATVPNELRNRFVIDVYAFDPEKEARPDFYQIVNSGQVSCEPSQHEQHT